MPDSWMNVPDSWMIMHGSPSGGSDGVCAEDGLSDNFPHMVGLNGSCNEGLVHLAHAKEVENSLILNNDQFIHNN